MIQDIYTKNLCAYTRVQIIASVHVYA